MIFSYEKVMLQIICFGTFGDFERPYLTVKSDIMIQSIAYIILQIYFLSDGRQSSGKVNL